jgi:hypothetical protein
VVMTINDQDALTPISMPIDDMRVKNTFYGMIY